MSRIDAAWKRASGELVEDPPPAPIAPAAPPSRIAPAALRTRVAAAVPPSSLDGKLVGTPHIEAISVEQYKRLATALHQLQVQRGIRSLTISSALPREGKTLTAANLALTLGSFYGRQVLVIDADLHRPSIHAMFGMPNDCGLIDALRSSDTPLSAIQVTPAVSVVTAGHAPEPSTWVLSSDRLNFLIAEASGQYDWILVDTPPAATLTDAQFIARATDGILFVIGAGTTPYPLVQRCVTELGADRIVGTVLNRVVARALPVGSYYHQQYADQR